MNRLLKQYEMMQKMSKAMAGGKLPGMLQGGRGRRGNPFGF